MQQSNNISGSLINIDTMSIYGTAHCVLYKGSQVGFFIFYDVFLSLNVVLILKLVNGVDPDEMQQYAAFHLDLHCLQKYPFKGFQYTEGYYLLTCL